MRGSGPSRCSDKSLPISCTSFLLFVVKKLQAVGELNRRHDGDERILEEEVPAGA